MKKIATLIFPALICVSMLCGCKSNVPVVSTSPAIASPAQSAKTSTAPKTSATVKPITSPTTSTVTSPAASAKTS